MRHYLLIESRDPLAVREVEHDLALACSLARAGEDVTLFLVQNGVFAVRRGLSPDPLAAARAAGVRLLCDEFSLRERGIPGADLGAGIEVTGLDPVVDQLAAGHRTLWL